MSLLGQHFDPAPLIEFGQQRVIRRNWRFNFVPKMILIFALAIIAWEIMRTNLHYTTGLLSFEIMPLTPAINLACVFGALILARSQYAMAIRPTISWSAQPLPSINITDSGWTLHLMNGGPGGANLSKILYHLELKNGKSHLGTRKGVIQMLAAEGVTAGTDFHLELITRGALLPLAKSAKEGIEFAAFSVNALKHIAKLNFYLSVVDTIGDEHEKWLAFMATLPESLLEASKAK